VERQALAVRYERPDEDRRAHRSLPVEPHRGARVRRAPHGLDPLDQLHRADLRCAGDRAARERRAQEVERVPVLLQRARDGRDQVLDGSGAFQPAQARHAHASRHADAPEVVAQDVHDHHVLGTVLRTAEELASERPVSVAGTAARSRALDRMRPDVARLVQRQERLGRGGQERAPASRCVRTDVQERGERRRVARAKLAVDGPRLATERRFQAARDVRLVELAGGNRLAHLLHRANEGGAIEIRAECRRERGVVRPCLGGRLQPCAEHRGATPQGILVAVDRTAGEPRGAARALPAHHEVVQAEAQLGQRLVVRGARGEALEPAPQVVGEEAGQPAAERG
jgi:hypothetical protein